MGNLIQRSQTQFVTEIVTRVSEMEGTDPLDLPPLYDSIDPEALDRLADSSDIRFEYAGYSIAIENGTIAIDQ
ncbi:HalOD1 output domain-containing protein [Haloterrigena salinisoli]|uniref:HalOD1 output domain-containing protein n=1 Tax=Haloterrigena salinisoli TaxID=3132747 RepID=UPI0030CF45A0